ncbi:MAG: hypothetical protein L0323_16945 [Planctomycetes bacterium]|nr:hypothetical protein [Planctomycetota bacterium]
MIRRIAPALAALLVSPCSRDDRNVRRAAWVADRGAGEVHLLGADLGLLATARCGGWPRVVAALPGGGAWVATGRGPEPSDPFDLARIGPDGALLAKGGPFGWVADLAGEPDGGAWVADRGRGLLVRVGPDGGILESASVAGIRCVERGRSRILHGDDQGNVVATVSGTRESWTIGGEATDVREAPDRGLWVLDATGPGRIWRLGGGGEAREVATLGFSAEHLAVDSSGIWVASVEAAFVRRFARDGEVLADASLDVPGETNFLEAWGRGVLLPVGGVLLEVGPSGKVRRSRTGFASLAGLAVGETPR